MTVYFFYEIVHVITGLCRKTKFRTKLQNWGNLMLDTVVCQTYIMYIIKTVRLFTLLSQYFCRDIEPNIWDSDQYSLLPWIHCGRLQGKFPDDLIFIIIYELFIIIHDSKADYCTAQAEINILNIFNSNMTCFLVTILLWYLIIMVVKAILHNHQPWAQG